MSISMSTVYATAVLSVSSTLASVLFLVSAYRRLERQSVAMLQWRVRVCVCVCVCRFSVLQSVVLSSLFNLTVYSVVSVCFCLNLILVGVTLCAMLTSALLMAAAMGAVF